MPSASSPRRLRAMPSLRLRATSALLRAVVQVALDAAALGVGRGDDPRLRGAGVDHLRRELRVGLGVQEQPRPVAVRDAHAVDEVPGGDDQQRADRHEEARLGEAVDVPEQDVDPARPQPVPERCRQEPQRQEDRDRREREPDDPQRELAREVRGVLPGLRVGDARRDRRPGALLGRAAVVALGALVEQAVDECALEIGHRPGRVQDADEDRDPEQRDEEADAASRDPRRG